MKRIGRIVSRGEKTAGLFIPFGKNCLPKGIYEIQEILGELTIVRIGDPAMPDSRFTSLDLGGLHAEMPLPAMTQEELDKVTPAGWAKVEENKRSYREVMRKREKMYKIYDWAGNAVNTGGKTFATFDEGWDWIRTNVPDQTAWQEFYVLLCGPDGKPIENE